jgi:hypothetical protein
MEVKQISLFLENKKEVVGSNGCPGKAKINIRALSIADTSVFVLRLIVPDRRRQKLSKTTLPSGKRCDRVEVSDTRRPGRVLKILTDADIKLNIYMPCRKSGKKAVVVLRTDSIKRKKQKRRCAVARSL